MGHTERFPARPSQGSASIVAVWLAGRRSRHANQCLGQCTLLTDRSTPGGRLFPGKGIPASPTIRVRACVAVSSGKQSVCPGFACSGWLPPEVSIRPHRPGVPLPASRMIDSAIAEEPAPPPVDIDCVPCSSMFCLHLFALRSGKCMQKEDRWKPKHPLGRFGGISFSCYRRNSQQEKPLEEAGVAVPFRAIPTACGMVYSAQPEQVHLLSPGGLFCWFCGPLRHPEPAGRSGSDGPFRCLYFRRCSVLPRSGIRRSQSSGKSLHVHLAVDKGLTRGPLSPSDNCRHPHLQALTLSTQLQLRDIAQLLDENGVLRPDTHLHAALRVAGEKSPEAM